MLARLASPSKQRARKVAQASRGQTHTPKNTPHKKVIPVITLRDLSTRLSTGNCPLYYPHVRISNPPQNSRRCIALRSQLRGNPRIRLRLARRNHLSATTRRSRTSPARCHAPQQPSLRRSRRPPLHRRLPPSRSPNHLQNAGRTSPQRTTSQRAHAGIHPLRRRSPHGARRRRIPLLPRKRPPPQRPERLRQNPPRPQTPKKPSRYRTIDDRARSKSRTPSASRLADRRSRRETLQPRHHRRARTNPPRYRISLRNRAANRRARHGAKTRHRRNQHRVH